MIMYEKQREAKLNGEEIQQLFEKAEKTFKANTFGAIGQVTEFEANLIAESKAPSEA